MATRDIVGIACSAGGLTPLRELIAGLPPSVPASTLVVRHLSSDSKGMLPSILMRSGKLPAAFAQHGELISPGRVQIAPPGHHLLVHEEELLLSRGPKINRVRPSADALFRSMARWHGSRAVAVVLSGTLDDGAAGAAAIAARGGAVIVQDPDEAGFPSMPANALRSAPGAVTAPTAQLAEAVLDLVGKPVADTAGPIPADLIWETDMTELAEETPPDRPPPGRPAGVSCPECFGAMNLIDGLDDLHFRCHVGHVYSPLTLLADQARAGESALWHAIALLEEQASIRLALARRAGEGHRHQEERSHLEAAAAAKSAADAVRAQIPDDAWLQDPAEEA
jgi:two-component system chemotaxis response regulator CheB